jgi:hypothetical protein
MRKSLLIACLWCLAAVPGCSWASLCETFFEDGPPRSLATHRDRYQRAEWESRQFAEMHDSSLGP